MLLALSAMSPGWEAFFFIAAVVCFVLATLGAGFVRVNLVALGLALFVVPFAWNALAAS